MASRSPALRQVFETCARVAATGASVLLLGETGTGKELLARAIHRRSERRGRYVAVNCGALTESLVGSEFFGHLRGSFTGASDSKLGLFRFAQGGTLFLDEVGSIPASAQFSLLRTLQEGSVRPVGGNAEIPVDVRIIAATSEPLERAVHEGRFRADLLYRLDVIRVVLPPLRERQEDIPFLFGHFCEQLARRYDLAPPRPDPEFVRAMLRYSWPGNVRQLENFAQRLVLTAAEARLTRDDFLRLTRPYRGSPATIASTPSAGRLVDLSLTLEGFLDPIARDLERRYLQEALAANRGRVQATARTAGLSRRTLLRKLIKHGIDKRDFREGAPGQPCLNTSDAPVVGSG